MALVRVSSEGRVVLPAALRRRLGLNAGTRLEVIEEPDGLRLRVHRVVPATAVASLAGMVETLSSGRLRQLEDFDPATLTAAPPDD